MKYIDRVLGPNEHILHETGLHWITFTRPLVWLFAIPIVWLFADPNKPEHLLAALVGSAIFFVIFAVGLFLAWLRWWTTEFAVTNRRVVFKRGLIARDTIELNFNRVEGLDVTQSIWGRLLNYGTVVVRGTGRGTQPMKDVSGPIALRNAAFGAN